MSSEYDRIKRGCQKRGEIWEDPDFPAIQTSVFYHQTPPFQFAWKRPKELCARPGFIQDGANVPFDVSPGKMGDRWLVSCLGVLHLNKGLFYRVVPADQSFVGDQYFGIFRFRLWWCGEWAEVLVDDRLPTVHGRLAFLHCQQSDHFWPGLLEKAYAKLHGSYEALKYGSLLDGLADLTGGITESIPLVNPQSTALQCIRTIQKLLEITTIVTCSIPSPNSGTQTNTNHSNNNSTTVLMNNKNSTNITSIPNDGFVQHNASINYRVCALERLEGKNESEDGSNYVIKLCSPLPTNNKDLLTPLIQPVNDLKVNNKKQSNNCDEFWLNLRDFLKLFNGLDVVHLDGDTSRDEPSLQYCKHTWQMRLYQGRWQKGISAGGCRNHPETFHINPQLHLAFNSAEIQQDVVISLNQHSIMEPKVIGFTAYALPKSTALDTVQRVFFKKHKSLFNSQYTNSRQVSHRWQQQSQAQTDSGGGGGLLIVPTTFEPGQEVNFTLRVFSNRAFKLKPFDTISCVKKSPITKAPPLLDGNNKSFSQYEAVFLQLADEHRTVNAFELHELLDACLPNDYIKSCASIDVCRQIVFTFDNTLQYSGRLKFNDFKDLMCSLKCWQTAFKNHTKEKAGILRAERLRDALRDVGFQLGNDVLVTLVLRFMRKDGTLRFGDFVSAILHLTNALNIFNKRDTQQIGIVKVNLSEWLKSSLSC